MPRTRVRNQKTVKSKLEDDGLQGAKKLLANYRKEILDTIENARQNMLCQVDNKFIGDRMMIIKKYNNMTLAELANSKSVSSLSSSCISGNSISNITSTIKSKKNIKRSSSCAGDDEGPRASRSRIKKTVQKSRMTRSLSRTTKTIQQQRESSVDRTPLNKVTPPNTYGLITPKVKPNTPLVLVRRPKMGEVALSMQGSPLLTAPVVTDNTANINIPLVDGTLLSLQAQRGLRKSQIPDLDPDVKRQLELLRENLNLII